MRTIRKLVLAGFATAILLGAVSGTAAALRSLAVNAPWMHAWGHLTFNEPTNFIKIWCKFTIWVTLNNRTIAKRPTNPIGRAAITEPTECEGGTTMRILREGQPWPVNYISFAGTLPRITELTLQIERAAFVIRSAIGECLFLGNVRVIAKGNPITRYKTDETDRVLLFRTISGSCNETFRLEGELETAERVEMFLL